MALPGDLRHVLWQQLPFTIVENFPAAVLRLWLAFVAPAASLQQSEAENALLTTQEYFLKVASWAGFVGYTNQLFLPYDLSLLQAALSGNVPLFIDAFRRGSRHSRTAIAALRQAPATAIIMLRYLIAADQCEINFTELVDEMLLGRIVLTPAICQLLLVEEDHQLNMSLRGIMHGTLAAFTQNYQLPDVIDNYHGFLLGYALAGGRAFARFTPALDDFTLSVAFATLNLPETPLPESDQDIAISEIPYHIFAKMPKTGTRTFPTLAYQMDAHGYEVYHERAQKMLPLLPEIYAPSSELTRYIDYLRLLINPKLPANQLTAVPAADYEFLTLIGRFDLMDQNVLEDAELEDRELLSLIYQPELLFDLFMEFPADQKPRNLLNVALGQAALQGRLNAVAQQYFIKIPRQSRLRNIYINDFETLELFRDIYYTADSEYRQKSEWDNSFLLQWVATELELAKIPSQPDGGAHKVLLDFRCRGNYLTEHTNAYDYATWRLIWPTLPALVITDRVSEALSQLP